MQILKRKKNEINFKIIINIRKIGNDNKTNIIIFRIHKATLTVNFELISRSSVKIRNKLSVWKKKIDMNYKD